MAWYLVKHRDIITIIEVEIFWGMTQCSVVVSYQRFIGSHCLYLQDEGEGSVDL
jgi:hypothetical protein